MGKAVGSARAQQAEAEHAGGIVGERPAVEQHFDFARDEGAVALDPGPDADLERMARAHHLEIFLAREDHLHRALRLQRERRNDRLHVRLHLVAERPADARGQAANAGHRDAERLGDAGLHPEHGLVGRPDGESPLRIDFRERAAGLERDVRLGLGLEVVLEHDVRLAKSPLDVALGELGAGAQVALAAGIEDLEVLLDPFVDVHAGGERFLGREQRRQLLVIDADRLRRGARDRLGVGGDRSDGLADVAHLALRQGVLVLDEGAHAIGLREVVPGDDRVHARHRERLGEVVAADARVRERALQDGAVQHPRPVQVGDVLRPAFDLLARLEARNAPADGFADLFERCAHVCSFPAAVRTASMILL